jgi:hypothetical protein
MPDSDNQGSSSSDLLRGLANASRRAPSLTQSCQQDPKHWVKVLLHYADDHSPVPATDCLHESGEAVNSGPLADGQLETRDLDPGSYEVSFPDIDAREWSVE